MSRTAEQMGTRARGWGYGGADPPCKAADFPVPVVSSVGSQVRAGDVVALSAYTRNAVLPLRVSHAVADGIAQRHIQQAEEHQRADDRPRDFRDQHARCHVLHLLSKPVVHGIDTKSYIDRGF